MLMETNVSYTVAGAFILALLAAIVVTVIWLSSGFNNKKYNYYTVYMDESISGLTDDGPVEFNGVNVGYVDKMKINRENPQWVELTLAVEEGTPISDGTRAKLGMRSLTGVAYMLLEDKGTDMRPLVAQPGQRYPVIRTTPSLLVRLDAILTKVSDDITRVSNSINQLLSKSNLNTFKNILHSGQGSMQMIETQTLPGANDAINNFNDMTRSMNSVVSEIRENPAIVVRGKAPPTKLGPGER